MAGSSSGTERLDIRAIRNDDLRLSGCMENTGVVLEILPLRPTAVQREHHHYPQGITQRERHEKLHPHCAPALRLGVARRTCRSHREGFDLAFPGKRSPARTQPPVEELDLEAMEELLMWDEYRDW